MNAKLNYNNLAAAREEFEARMKLEQEKLNEATDRIITRRLQHLNYVGNSVLKKKFGTHYLRAEHYEFLGDLGKFLQSWSPKVEKLGDNSIQFSNFTLDRRILSFSDRDFAKLIRHEVAKHKMAKKKGQLEVRNKELQASVQELRVKQDAVKAAEKAVEAARAQVDDARKVEEQADASFVKYQEAVAARRARRQQLKRAGQYHVTTDANAVRRCANGADSCKVAYEDAHFTSKEAAQASLNS